MVPDHLKYTTTHEWCSVDGAFGLIGVTAYALKTLGAIVCVELPDVGDDMLFMVPFGEIEGLRDAKRLVSPLDGVVEEVNGRIAHKPDLLVEDPYEEGWLIRLKLALPHQFVPLLSAADYRQLVRRKRNR